MDDNKLRKALAMLRSFNDNLPKGRIEEKYVTLYNDLLTELEQQTGHDLAYFQVPSSEIYEEIVSTSFNEWGQALNAHSTGRYCDRSMMQIKLQGLLNYLNSFLPDTPAKRIVGFAKPE